MKDKKCTLRPVALSLPMVARVGQQRISGSLLPSLSHILLHCVPQNIRYTRTLLEHHEKNFAPKSNLGKWSIGLIVVMPILFFIGMSFVDFYESIPAGKTIPHDIIVRPGIALPMLVGFIFGIVAFFTGIIGITKKKDYSVLIFIFTILGFFVLLWVFAEILFPH